METSAYPTTHLHIRLTLTPGRAIRIEHAYSRSGQPDDWRTFTQVPQGVRRIRRVWNELRVLMATWLVWENAYEDDVAPERAQSV